MHSTNHLTRSVHGTMLTAALAFLVFLHADGIGAKTRQQETDDAAKVVQRKFKQYKRVHQEILKIIVEGNAKKAIGLLEEILRVVPKDGESQYMLAVALASDGQDDKAIAAVKRARDLGIPESRFIGGTKTGLEDLRKLAKFQSLFPTGGARLIHGPVLGNNTGKGISIWVRTASASEVQIRVVDPDGISLAAKASARSSLDTDFTCVIRVEGLTPNSNYAYSVVIDGVEVPETFKLRTLTASGMPTEFRVAFGGGAGYVPQNEVMWNTIADAGPDVLMLLGDNVYSDAPEMPEMQHYCYYRRQSRPEYRTLTAQVPVYTIWDDHDFGTNDCQGGPFVESPPWKVPVWRVFKNNTVNPGYGGGIMQPGCWYDYYVGDVHFIMTDGRTYRTHNPENDSAPTMLGPIQKEWLKQTIKNSKGVFTVLVSPVPWVFGAKGNSKDTWNGFKEERGEIFDIVRNSRNNGVLLMSADRHRSDLWKIKSEGLYPLYEFNSSRLTNQHVHPEMREAEFSYNSKQSFGIVDFDTKRKDPTVTYSIQNIVGKEIYRRKILRSEISHN
ncbi:MAG: alkaline phosphatase D family protein [Planctomycetota bacterium]|nr:alkaline phosphatase D family protein [Planctomycetota bacterium]